MKNVFSAVCGLIFGIGLIISGMVNPAKVQNFLDIAGYWDPSLAFVMGSALVVTGLGFALLRRRTAPFLMPSFNWPTRTDIDAPLLAGAALFGIGWGLSGLCPGPAITMGLTGISEIAVFVGAMLASIAAFKWIRR